MDDKDEPELTQEAFVIKANKIGKMIINIFNKKEVSGSLALSILTFIIINILKNYKKEVAIEATNKLTMHLFEEVNKFKDETIN
jgi:hypothetical protein